MPSPPVLSRPLHRGSSLSAPPGGARSQRTRRICTSVSGVDTALSPEEGRWTASPAPASPGWAGEAQWCERPWACHFSEAAILPCPPGEGKEMQFKAAIRGYFIPNETRKCSLATECQGWSRHRNERSLNP